MFLSSTMRGISAGNCTKQNLRSGMAGVLSRTANSKESCSYSAKMRTRLISWSFPHLHHYCAHGEKNAYKCKTGWGNWCEYPRPLKFQGIYPHPPAEPTATVSVRFVAHSAGSFVKLLHIASL